MSLQVYISSNGERLAVTLEDIPSPEALKAWLEQNTGIAVERQILMTAKGKNVKQQHLLSEGEIFVYDKRYLSAENNANDPGIAELSLSEPRSFPSSLEDEQSLSAWQDLFASRRAWALEIAELVKEGVQTINRGTDESEVLERCTQVALENLQNHFVSLQQTASRTQTWAENTVIEHNAALKDWKVSLDALSELPVREEIAQFLNVSNKEFTGNASGTMFTMIDLEELESASQRLSVASKRFQSNISELETYMSKLREETEVVTMFGAAEWPDLNTDGIIQEIEAMTAKASRDYEEVLRTPNDQKSIAAVSRAAARHTQELLPAMDEIARDIGRMVVEVNSLRITLAANCRRALKEISGIQSQFAGMHARVAGLKVDDEGDSSLSMLDRVFRLPIAYGSTMIEAIRRTEWNESMRKDLDGLREEITQHKDDELRRRKKWISSLGDLIDHDAATEVKLIDLSFSVPSNTWPYVTREEIFAYIEDLRALGIDDAVAQVTQLLKGLDSITKSRKANQKAFKNGSVLDLGQSIMRNGEQTKALQDDKLRLEEKLRAADSRVRKLEDLLHRQSQLARPVSGTFAPQIELERQFSSPGPNFARPAESQSRRSSVSLRRLSNHNMEEKAMVQRIVGLEAQIMKLQEEAQAERRSSSESRDKMQEAESVKRDLMANFEAQRQEFDDERQLLDDENHKLKIRLEEVEDELDRVLGSRDHQRLTQEQSIANLRNELDHLRRTLGGEIDQLRMSKERVQNDYTSQRDRILFLERQEQQQKELKSSLQSEVDSLTKKVRASEEKQNEIVGSLQAAHSHLSPSGSAPDDIDRLLRALELLTEGAAIHARGLDDNLQFITAENKAQQRRISELETQLQRSEDRLRTSKEQTAEAQQESSVHRNQLNVVRGELSDERNELQKLREKFAAGETGSDALRLRLANEEVRVTELLEVNGQKDARLEALQRELDDLAVKGEDSNSAEEAIRESFDARGKRAKDLSERLYQQNDRMIRMLESFGYVITQQDEALVLQRASKVGASTTLSAEGSSPMKRTISGSTPAQHYYNSSDLDNLHWISDQGQKEEEEAYQQFIKAMSRLDLNSTTDVLIKRYTYVENLAKKYQKDSRAHRDRCHRLQNEAHEKIAYRSFKEGDLALFLPTRNQAIRSWAAFNVGAPHHFLREQDVHKLQSRDWLLARITKVQEHVVDLARSLAANRARSPANAEGSDGASTRSVDDENPFDLSDGLRWYMIDAVEEKLGAPSTPGLGKSTAAASVVEVKGHMSRKTLTGREANDGSAVNVTKTLNKSLDSRRSSEASRKSGNMPAVKAQGSNNSGIHAAASAAAVTTNVGAATGTEGIAEGRMSTATPSVKPSDEDVRSSSQGAAREDASVFDVDDGSPASTRVSTRHARQSPLKTTSPARPRLESPNRYPQGPQKQTNVAAKKPWQKLFSLEYKG